MENKLEKKENLGFVSFKEAMKKLGQTQYSSMFVNPNPKAHDDGLPFFSDIRIEGEPSNYYDFKIHKDDIRKFIEMWLNYKKKTSPFFKDKSLEDFL